MAFKIADRRPIGAWEPLCIYDGTRSNPVPFQAVGRCSYKSFTVMIAGRFECPFFILVKRLCNAAERHSRVEKMISQPAKTISTVIGTTSAVIGTTFVGAETTSTVIGATSAGVETTSTVIETTSAGVKMTSAVIGTTVAAVKMTLVTVKMMPASVGMKSSRDRESRVVAGTILIRGKTFSV
jgi:hypothetical protein